MLKILRKKGVAKKVLWFVAIIIIISFGFLGTAYLFTGQNQITNAGSIFGKTVTFPEFENAYRDVRIQALIQHGDKFNDYVNLVDLNAETWDRLILLHEAKRRRLKANDAEVVRTIQQYPFFQRDGVFDNLLYQDISRYIFGVKARDFEEATRDSILIGKLFAQETFSVTVLEEEIRQAFQKQNEKVQVSYVLISPERFKDEAAFDEAAARQYFDDNPDEFTLPESINVEYVRIPFPAADEAQESEETASPKKQAGDLAEKLFMDLANHPDFTSAAAAHQLEVKTSGFFTMEEPKLDMGMSYELLKRLFDMQTDAVTEPVETSDAFFLVKVVERKEAAIPAYDEVKEKVKDAILTEKAMGVARQKAEEILPQLKTEYESVLPHDFADAAKKLGLELGQTPVFNRGQYLPQIGIAKDFQEAAFKLSESAPISGVVQAEKGFYILHLDQYVPADPQEYDMQKDVIAQFLLAQKRNEVFGAFLSELRLQADLEDNISRLEQ